MYHLFYLRNSLNNYRYKDVIIFCIDFTLVKNKKKKAANQGRKAVFAFDPTVIYRRFILTINLNSVFFGTLMCVAFFSYGCELK